MSRRTPPVDRSQSRSAVNPDGAHIRSDRGKQTYATRSLESGQKLIEQVPLLCSLEEHYPGDPTDGVDDDWLDHTYGDSTGRFVVSRHGHTRPAGKSIHQPARI